MEERLKENLRELYALHQASTKKRKDDLLRSAQGTMREFLSTRAGFNTTGPTGSVSQPSLPSSRLKSQQSAAQLEHSIKSSINSFLSGDTPINLIRKKRKAAEARRQGLAGLAAAAATAEGDVSVPSSANQPHEEHEKSEVTATGPTPEDDEFLSVQLPPLHWSTELETAFKQYRKYSRRQRTAIRGRSGKASAASTSTLMASFLMSPQYRSATPFPHLKLLPSETPQPSAGADPRSLVQSAPELGSADLGLLTSARGSARSQDKGSTTEAVEPGPSRATSPASARSMSFVVPAAAAGSGGSPSPRRATIAASKWQLARSSASPTHRRSSLVDLLPKPTASFHRNLMKIKRKEQEAERNSLTPGEMAFAEQQMAEMVLERFQTIVKSFIAARKSFLSSNTKRQRDKIQKREKDFSEITALRSKREGLLRDLSTTKKRLGELFVEYAPQASGSRRRPQSAMARPQSAMAAAKPASALISFGTGRQLTVLEDRTEQLRATRFHSFWCQSPLLADIDVAKITQILEAAEAEEKDRLLPPSSKVANAVEESSEDTVKQEPSAPQINYLEKYRNATKALNLERSWAEAGRYAQRVQELGGGAKLKNKHVRERLAAHARDVTDKAGIVMLRIFRGFTARRFASALRFLLSTLASSFVWEKAGGLTKRGGVGVFVITDLSSLPKRPGAEVFGLRGEEMLRLSLPNLPIAEDLQVSSTDFLRWWRYQLLDDAVIPFYLRIASIARQLRDVAISFILNPKRRKARRPMFSEELAECIIAALHPPTAENRRGRRPQRRSLPDQPQQLEQQRRSSATAFPTQGESTKRPSSAHQRPSPIRSAVTGRPGRSAGPSHEAPLKLSEVPRISPGPALSARGSFRSKRKELLDRLNETEGELDSLSIPPASPPAPSPRAASPVRSPEERPPTARQPRPTSAVPRLYGIASAATERGSVQLHSRTRDRSPSKSPQASPTPSIRSARSARLGRGTKKKDNRALANKRLAEALEASRDRIHETSKAVYEDGTAMLLGAVGTLSGNAQLRAQAMEDAAELIFAETSMDTPRGHGAEAPAANDAAKAERTSQTKPLRKEAPTAQTRQQTSSRQRSSRAAVKAHGGWSLGGRGPSGKPLTVADRIALRVGDHGEKGAQGEAQSGTKHTEDAPTRSRASLEHSSAAAGTSSQAELSGMRRRHQRQILSMQEFLKNAAEWSKNAKDLAASTKGLVRAMDTAARKAEQRKPSQSDSTALKNKEKTSTLPEKGANQGSKPLSQALDGPLPRSSSSTSVLGVPSEEKAAIDQLIGNL